MGGNPLKKLGEGLGTVVTGGLNKTNLGGGAFRKLGNNIGNALTLGTARLRQGENPSGSSSYGGTQSPMDMLVNTGGAPLLANISMGGNTAQELANFLGLDLAGIQAMVANPEDPNIQAYQGISKEEAKQIKGLYDQLNSIQTNTNLKNKTIQNLVNDFPNFMAQKVPEFAKLMDNETKAMMDQALSKVGAQFAAGGQLSSGATAEAAARAGADIGMQRLQYGTSLAGQDWQNQFNEANALRNFQMNMLGQQSQNGFNAVQNALQQNTQIGLTNAGFQNQQNLQNQQQQNQMWQGLGQLGGTIVGGFMGGPWGAMAGGQVGGQLGGAVSGNSGYTSNPRLNLNYGFGGR